MDRNAIKARATRRPVVSSIMLLIAVGIYLLKRYWYAILLVAITLVGLS